MVMKKGAEKDEEMEKEKRKEYNSRGFLFLDASSHLFMKVSPSVRLYVRMSVFPLGYKRNCRE